MRLPLHVSRSKAKILTASHKDTWRGFFMPSNRVRPPNSGATRNEDKPDSPTVIIKTRARSKKMNKRRGFNKVIGFVVIAMIALSAIAELVWVTCPRCNGRKFLCSYCNGTGQMRCTVFNGTGKFMGWACTACTGGKRMCTNCVMSPACPQCNAAGGYWVNK